jgi:predicted ATPase/class 3 adenylate cyclase
MSEETTQQTPLRRLETGSYTFLFTDIEGSTRLWERDPEAMKTALAAHDALMRQAIGPHGGRVFKTMGDAFYAVFTSAREAIAAALQAQRSLITHPWAGIGPIRVRMALHSGPAELRDGDYFGPTLNRVARILAVGHGGQTLVSQAVYALVADSLPPEAELQDLGAHRLRDLHRPEHIFGLLATGLPAEFPTLRSLDALPNNLPRQLTSFIGREQEIAEIKQRLEQTTLLTIVGAGGAGKTRLALQVAADLLEEFADGVWLVELAPVSDAAQVPQAVASALGVRTEPGRPVADTVTEYLQPKQAMLILDNCEHVVAACAGITERLLRACPRLRFLCTSREALGVAGEVAWRIPSLSLPDPHHLPATERLSEYEAIRLFVERAAAVSPGFALTSEHAAAVASICQRLDGIPLAIELAAARVKVLSVSQVSARLDDRFRLLTGGSRTALPRQQTLRAAMDWSYDLLSEDERAVLRRLSVFAGGWTLEAVEAICAGQGVEEGEVLDVQSALVDKSLVVVEDLGSQARYRLLETVRQYARDKLLEAGEAAVWRSRHRDWHLELAEQAEPYLQGPEQTVWLDRLGAEHENLHVALEWSAGSGENDKLVRLALALWWYWLIRGHLTEGNHWAQEAVERTSGRTAIRSRVLAAATVLAYEEGDYTQALRCGAEGHPVARELNDTLSAAMTLVVLSLIAMARGERDRAASLAEEARALLPDLHNLWGQAIVGLLLAERARVSGNWTESLAGFQRSLEQFRQVGDLWGVALAHRGLGFIARGEGDYERAAALHEEGLVHARRLGDKTGTAYALLSLAVGDMRQGHYGAAEARMREALGLIRDTGDKIGLANVLYYLGLAISFQGRNDEAQQLMHESREISQSVGARLNVAYSTSGLARVAMHRGDTALTTTLALEAQKLFKDAGDRWGVGVTLYILGAAAVTERAHDRALAFGEESLKLFQELGDGWAAGSSMRLIARASLGRADYERAQRLYEESLRSARTRGELLGVARALMGLALVAARVNEFVRAAVLLGADQGLRDEMGVPVPEAERPAFEHVVETVRTGLGEAAFAESWKKGREMGWEHAADYALESPQTTPA